MNIGRFMYKKLNICIFCAYSVSATGAFHIKSYRFFIWRSPPTSVIIKATEGEGNGQNRTCAL